MSQCLQQGASQGFVRYPRVRLLLSNLFIRLYYFDSLDSVSSITAIMGGIAGCSRASLVFLGTVKQQYVHYRITASLSTSITISPHQSKMDKGPRRPSENINSGLQHTEQYYCGLRSSLASKLSRNLYPQGLISLPFRCRRPIS